MTIGAAAVVPRSDVTPAQRSHSSSLMKPFLRQQLERFPVRLQELDFFLAQPEVVNDMTRYREITREHAEVSLVAGRYHLFQQRERDLAQAREMLEDPEMADMAKEELS